MGDCVLTTPGLSLLKTARPDLEIGVAVEPRFAAIFDGNPAVSKIIEPNWMAVRRWKREAVRESAWRVTQPLDDSA